MSKKQKYSSEDAQKLDQTLRESPLASGKQRKLVWKTFKKEGLDAALKIVESATKQIQLQPPVPYQIWGSEGIDENTLKQMKQAASLPISVKGALMPDAHLGYGLPIGGVMATEDAVMPYAVGVDIACRMKLTVYAIGDEALYKHEDLLKDSLMKETRFGAGAQFEKGNLSEHPVLDSPDWNATRLLEGLIGTAQKQLGSSGGGNHFVEWGLFTLDKGDNVLGVQDAGTYLALLSHSGSRGVGYKIANHYSKLAMSERAGLPESVKHLAWFEMDSELGREYWLSMQLAGEFASANHAVIHDRITKATGFEVLAQVENHHNFAWKEQVDGKEVIVHRKGATPAGRDVLGIIPGSMGDPGFVIRGKGSEESVNSASHGAGRKMSRRQAIKTIKREQQINYLKQQGIQLLGGGLDESPQAYKSIHDVMEAQQDLVHIVGQFDPKIVRMADD